MLKLPEVSSEVFDIKPINWAGLPKRYLNPGELEILIALIRFVCPMNVLEFGCNNGRTAKAILDNVPGIRDYQGIDVLPGYQFEKEVQRNEIPEKPGELALSDHRFELILRTGGSFDLLAKDLLPCDVAFIDGDHSRSAVLNDTALAMELVRPRGMIIWHDYHDLGTVDVREVLEEIHATGSSIRHVRGTWLAYLLK